MKQLVRRALAVYQDEGISSTVAKSIRYLRGSIHHTLGKAFLYGNPHYHALLIWWNGGRGCYDALADPFRIYLIDPKRINYLTNRGPNPGRFKWQHLGLVQAGTWDIPTDRFEDIFLYQGLTERYEKDVPWNETAFIERVREQVANGTNEWKRKFRSEEDIQRTCNRVDALYHSILEQGYKTQKELLDAGEINLDKETYPAVCLAHNEVAVDIGRDGQYLFVDGRHRLSIAKILGLEEIPVRVSARHTQWQAIRERVAAADDPQKLPDSITQHLDHPDLQDVLTDELDGGK